jgi:hypothetical protein
VSSNSHVQSYNILPEFENEEQFEQQLEPLLEQQQPLQPFIEQQQQQLQPLMDEAKDLMANELVDPYELFKNIQFGGNF